MYFIGIDPGLTGAIVILAEKGDTGLFYDTPITQVKSGKKTKNEYLPSEMAGLLSGYTSQNCHVFIESVHSMPGQGVSSSFNFGKGFGIWIGILAALKLPYTLATPQAWKKLLMQGMKDKDAARIRAQELFPGCVSQLSRKKDIGRADALLIAEYGRRILKRQTEIS